MKPRSSTAMTAAERGRYWPFRYASTAAGGSGSMEGNCTVAVPDRCGLRKVVSLDEQAVRKSILIGLLVFAGATVPTSAQQRVAKEAPTGMVRLVIETDRG